MSGKVRRKGNRFIENSSLFAYFHFLCEDKHFFSYEPIILSSYLLLLSVLLLVSFYILWIFYYIQLYIYWIVITHFVIAELYIKNHCITYPYSSKQCTELVMNFPWILRSAWIVKYVLLSTWDKSVV